MITLLCILIYRSNNSQCKVIYLLSFTCSPPGTGKTMLAKAAANEGGAKSFFYLSKPDLVTKWVGSSEKRIKQLFKLAAEIAPSVIFLGEMIFV